MNVLKQYSQKEIKQAIYEIDIESLCGISDFKENEDVREYLEIMEAHEIFEIENVIHINKYNKALLKFGVNN